MLKISLTHEVISAKYLIQDRPQIMDFVVCDADKDRTIVAQEVSLP
jgi:hypothetical protein